MRKSLITSLLYTAITAVLLGIAYPLAMTALAQVLFPDQANGQLVTRNGVTVGSRIIGQPFTEPGYFHGRPSAAGANGYDAASSGGSNYGPTNSKYIERVENDIADLQKQNPGVPVPIDLVTASGSGLDPDITPAAAEFQVSRVARERGVPQAELRKLVAAHIEPRQFGFLGEPRVNVLELNLALDQLALHRNDSANDCRLDRLCADASGTGAVASLQAIEPGNRPGAVNLWVRLVPSGEYGPLGSSSNPYMEVNYVRVYPYSTKTTSTTLSPIAEAYVQDGDAATTNFAGSPMLFVKNGETGNKQKSYLKFDLSKITGPVLQATLYLTPAVVGESKTADVANYVPNSKTVNVASYVPSNSWTASGMTWNSQPAISARLSTGTKYGQGILTTFDVTDMAKAGKQFSVQIAGDISSGQSTSVAYGSQKNGTPNYRPRLVIISATSSDEE